MTDTRKNRLLRTMLFSGLGIFACLLLGNYTNLPPEAVARLGYGGSTSFSSSSSTCWGRWSCG